MADHLFYREHGFEHCGYPVGDGVCGKLENNHDDGTPLPPLTEGEIAALKVVHAPRGFVGSSYQICNHCVGPGRTALSWPRITIRLLAHVEAQGERITVLEAEAAQEETWQQEAVACGAAWEESRAQVGSLKAQLAEKDARIATLESKARAFDRARVEYIQREERRRAALTAQLAEKDARIAGLERELRATTDALAVVRELREFDRKSRAR